MNNRRFIVLAFLVAAVVAGATARNAIVAGFAVAGAPDPLLASIAPASSVGGLAVGAGTLLVLLRIPVAVSFTGDVVGELARVTWPDREETVRSTTVVIVSASIFAAFLAVADLVWGELTSIFLFVG